MHDSKRLLILKAFAFAGIIEPVLIWVLLLITQALHPGYNYLTTQSVA